MNELEFLYKQQNMIEARIEYLECLELIDKINKFKVTFNGEIPTKEIEDETDSYTFISMLK